MNENYEFKVGDKVKYVGTELEYGLEGVINFDDTCCSYAVEFKEYLNGADGSNGCDGYCTEGYGYWCSGSSLELIEEEDDVFEEDLEEDYKLQIGDEVEYIGGSDIFADISNKKGIIKNIDDDEYAVEFYERNDYLHDCKGKVKNEHGWHCCKDNLKLIRKASEIEKETKSEDNTCETQEAKKPTYTIGGSIFIKTVTDQITQVKQQIADLENELYNKEQYLRALEDMLYAIDNYTSNANKED